MQNAKTNAKNGRIQVLHLILSYECKMRKQIQKWSNIGTSLNPVLQVQNTDRNIFKMWPQTSGTSFNLVFKCEIQIHIQNKYKEWPITGTSLNPVLQMRVQVQSVAKYWHPHPLNM